MAASMNRVTLIGRLGKDPDCKATANSNAVTILSLATEESWKKDGQKQTRTEWHRVVLYGKPAELAAQYLGKGHRVMIEGQLQPVNGRTRTDRIAIKPKSFTAGITASCCFWKRTPMVSRLSLNTLSHSQACTRTNTPTHGMAVKLPSPCKHNSTIPTTIPFHFKGARNESTKSR